MDSQDAVSALSSVGITSVPVEPILGGWAYWTFDVGSRFIARFPRNDEIAEAAVREIAILPALSNEVSYLVPIPSRIGVWLDRPFMVYSRIPGRGLTQADDSRELLFALRDMLAQLHRFPVERASELLGCGSPQRAWRTYFEDMWPVIETVALPAIDVPTADRVRTEFGQFLDTPFDSPHCLIHNDLGPEHILVDETTGMPTGLIDFESAWIGDPAIDFVPLRALLGAHRLHALIEGRDLGGGLAERMRFYHWMGSVHAVIYGVREEHEDELRVAASELRKRLDVLP